jgi:hypothetical protein
MEWQKRDKFLPSKPFCKGALIRLFGYGIKKFLLAHSSAPRVRGTSAAGLIAGRILKWYRTSHGKR